MLDIWKKEFIYFTNTAPEHRSWVTRHCNVTFLVPIAEELTWQHHHWENLQAFSPESRNPSTDGLETQRNKLKTNCVWCRLVLFLLHGGVFKWQVWGDSNRRYTSKGYHTHVHLACHGKKRGTRAFVISHGGHRTKYLCVQTWDENRLLGKLKVKTADQREPSDKLHWLTHIPTVIPSSCPFSPSYALSLYVSSFTPISPSLLFLLQPKMCLSLSDFKKAQAEITATVTTRICQTLVRLTILPHLKEMLFIKGCEGGR